LLGRSGLEILILHFDPAITVVIRMRNAARQIIHIAWCWPQKALAVFVEIAGVAGTEKAASIGGVIDPAAQMGTCRVQTANARRSFLVIQALQPDASYGSWWMVRKRVPPIGMNRHANGFGGSDSG
jgi:hypothetical protein